MDCSAGVQLVFSLLTWSEYLPGKEGALSYNIGYYITLGDKTENWSVGYNF